MSARITVAPASANRRPIALPSPLAPPVTTARLPDSEISSEMDLSETSAMAMAAAPLMQYREW